MKDLSIDKAGQLEDSWDRLIFFPAACKPTKKAKKTKSTVSGACLQRWD